MHCCRKQRDIIARVLKQEFGDQLLYLTKEDLLGNTMHTLEKLKNKVKFSILLNMKY